MTPTALIITTSGINCDQELAEAFRRAGAQPYSVHLNRLMQDQQPIDDADLIGLPGGFGYGDAVAAGRIAATLMRERLYPALRRAIGRGVPMIAPCNGFQTAVQLGLLPGFDLSGESPPAPVTALTTNDSARFVDRWVRVEVPASSRCIWTRTLAGADPALRLLPVAHGEGRFVTDDETLARLEANGMIALRYAADDDPNGSRDHIAGICDPSGLVLGLMPHPERYINWTDHPRWTRLSEDHRRGDPPGLAMFRAAVEASRTPHAVAGM